jgi:hypothetical protein
MSTRQPTDAWNAEARAVRRLCKLIRETLQQHPTETSGEIADLVKDRLAKLKIPWEPRQLHDALSALDQRVTGQRVTPRAPPEMAQQVDPPWRQFRQPSSGWTSTATIAGALTRSNRRSDRST